MPPSHPLPPLPQHIPGHQRAQLTVSSFADLEEAWGLAGWRTSVGLADVSRVPPHGDLGAYSRKQVSDSLWAPFSPSEK